MEKRADNEAKAARKAEAEAQALAKAEAEAKRLAQSETRRADQQLRRAEWLVYAGKLSLAERTFQGGNGLSPKLRSLRVAGLKFENLASDGQGLFDLALLEKQPAILEQFSDAFAFLQLPLCAIVNLTQNLMVGREF